MDFVDASGTRYQLTETAETPAPAKKQVVWPWVVGGLALAGGLVWMASPTSRKPNPVTPEIEALIDEARDPGTSRDRLWALFNHPEIEVRHALLDNPNVCPTQANGKLDTYWLEALAEALPEEVANHPLFVLHTLIEPTNEFEGVVRNVVKRTEDVSLIEHVFHKWGPSSWWVRQGVALNPNTPVDILRLLGNPETEEEWRVRQGVAENPNTPIELLRILGNEQTESLMYVRASVASNPNTPVGVLRILGNQETESVWGVREAVAKNPSTPVDTLHTLGSEQTESNKFVREAAQNALAARGLT